ncbi:hypothetical protein PPACK8108_LOCUS3361 [Phakopsora pachyrhizi]|uniref:Uncharacterized protein n=1 Tax=Phakopsora pachyrhizi TaxID=170000 RepID=A0AAV0AL18_PHAPC|nr:hypothetical protein PPACK8108_LOCUS3361 [Phakopsora pachyrhizi]
MTVLIDGKLENPLIKDKKVSLLGGVICGQKISMGSVSEGSSCWQTNQEDQSNLEVLQRMVDLRKISEKDCRTKKEAVHFQGHSHNQHTQSSSSLHMKQGELEVKPVEVGYIVWAHWSKLLNGKSVADKDVARGVFKPALMKWRIPTKIMTNQRLLSLLRDELLQSNKNIQRFRTGIEMTSWLEMKPAELELEEISNNNKTLTNLKAMGATKSKGQKEESASVVVVVGYGYGQWLQEKMDRHRQLQALEIGPEIEGQSYFQGLWRSWPGHHMRMGYKERTKDKEGKIKDKDRIRTLKGLKDKDRIRTIKGLKVKEDKGQDKEDEVLQEERSRTVE